MIKSQKSKVKNKKPFKLSALISLSAYLLISTLTLTSCKNNIADVKALSDTSTAVEEATNVESYLSQNARVKAKLNAPVMLRYQSQGQRTEFPKKLSVIFYDAALKPESFLFANYGRYNENENKVFLKDSVLIYNLKGDTMRTSELWWDQGQSKFYTDKPVDVKQRAPLTQHLIAIKGMDTDQTLLNPNLYDVIAPSYAIVPDSTLPGN